MAKLISERKRLLTLLLVTVFCVTAAVVIAISLTYHTSYNTHTRQLQLSVSSQKELISAIGRFDAQNSQSDHPGGALGGTLSQVIDAHSQYSLPADSSEFALLEYSEAKFNIILLHNKEGIEVSGQYGLGGREFALPDWFAPVEKIMIESPKGAQHFNGVIAVFDRVDISDRVFYIVSKIDVSEIRAPFVNASLIALLASLGLILLGAKIITNQVNPIIKDLNNQISFSNAILDTAGSPIIITNDKGVILQHNPAASLIFRYHNKPLKGLNIKQLIPDINTGDHKEMTGVCADNEEIIIQLANAETEVNGKRVNVNIATDITQRKQAEHSLHNTMAKTRAIIDTVNDGVFTIDDHGIIHSVNPATEKIFGYKCSELENHNINMLMPTPHHDRHDSYINNYLSTGKKNVVGNTREMEGRHKDGKIFPIELTVTEFFIEDNRYFTGVIRDISRRKSIELELQKHRENLEEMVEHATTEIKAIVETAVNGVITIDQHGIIQTFNPAAEKIFGWKHSDISGKKVATIIPGTNREAHDGYIQDYLDTSIAHIIGIGREVEAQRKDGTTFPANLSVGHTQLSDDKHLFVAFISDITEQKKAQHELIIAKDKAEQAARVKANFLANMSHEIRTPMNAIIGFSEILLQDKSLNEDSQHHAETILNSGKNLLNIINDILDFSKIESGSISLENVCFHLENTTRDTVRTLEFKAAENDIELTCNVSRDLPLRVMGDPTRIRQVIMNLMGNAIKFTRSGQVSLSVSSSNVPGEVLFRVTDTGIGMAPEQVDKVFDAFTQADTSTNRRFGGTGLGTTISKQLVEIMGGKIWVESEQGKGSTFSFTAKLDEAKDFEQCLFEVGDFGESNYQSPRAFRVLLAEDIPANATLATLRLKQQGHSVTWVKNGEKALQAALSGEHDIVLMDIQMPKMDGLTATQLIRSKWPTHLNHLPIIALTASVMKEDRQKCIDAGMDEVAAKPIDFPELLSIMENRVEQGVGTPNIAHPDVITPPDKEIDFSPVSKVADIPRGLDVWKDGKIYAQALLDFAQDYRNQGAEIIKRLQDNPGDLNPPRTIAHTLKGLAGNLYISNVANLAAQVDDQLKHNNAQQALTEANKLVYALNAASHAINKLSIPEDMEKKERKPLDREFAKEQLDNILTALDELNPDKVLPLLDELCSCIDKKALNAIKRSVSNFDFDRAKKEAESLAQHLQLLS